MKKILLSIFTFISLNAFCADYFVQGQLNFEDRLLFKTEVTDVDANDLVLHVKAIFKTNSNDVGEILLLVTPINYGAMDSLILKFDHRALGGICASGIYTNGKDCEDNGSTWTPTSGMIVHRDGVIDQVASNEYTTYDLYNGGSSFFTSSCSKSSMISHEECTGQPIAITISNPGFTWQTGNPVIVGAANEFDGTVNPLPVDNFIDFSKLFYLENTTVSQTIRYDVAGSYILNLPINSGYSAEKVNWYSAYFENESVNHAGVDLSTCDIWEQLTTPCADAFADYFGGGIISPGSGFDFLNMQTKVNNGQRTNLVGFSGDGILSPDFNISQIGPSESRTNPSFEGIDKWDIDRQGNKFDNIDKYFNESNTNGAGHASPVAHENIKHLRFLCHILDCPGNGLNDPEEGTTLPTGISSLNCDNANSMISIEVNFDEDTTNFAAAHDENGDCQVSPPWAAHGWLHCPVWNTYNGTIGGYDSINNSCITPVPLPVQSSYSQKEYIDVIYRKSPYTYISSPAPGFVMRVYEECRNCSDWRTSAMWVENPLGGYFKDNIVTGTTISNAIDQCSDVQAVDFYKIDDVFSVAQHTFLESIHYSLQYYWVYQGNNGKTCASRITWGAFQGTPWSISGP